MTPRGRGERIHLLGGASLDGGAVDGGVPPETGFVSDPVGVLDERAECLWDLYRSVPSSEVEGASCLDELSWLDEDAPNSSTCRLIHRLGERVPGDGEFSLGLAAQRELVALVLAVEADLEGRTVEGHVGEEFFGSTVWTYWATTFGFEPWHSLREMRRHLLRHLHLLDGLPDHTALKFPRLDRAGSMVAPVLAHLERHGVDVRPGATVQDVEVEVTGHLRTATRLLLRVDGRDEAVDLGEDDLVFVVNGSTTASATHGDHHTPARVSTEPDAGWVLWENLARRSEDFGRPSAFTHDLPDRRPSVAATATVRDPRVEPYLERLTRRDLHDHRVNTGGIVTVTDSGWLLSFDVPRQPHVRGQADGETVVRICGQRTEAKGDFVRTPMSECTGEEITQEWLYHLGVLQVHVPTLAQRSSITTVPVALPRLTAALAPCREGDRPDVVPEVAGPDDGVRELLVAAHVLRDRRSLREEPRSHRPWPGRPRLPRTLRGTWIEELLEDSGLL